MLSEDNKVDDSVEHLEKKVAVAQVNVVRGNGSFNVAMKHRPSLAHPRTILLILCVGLGFLCLTANGFDGSLFGGLTANPDFLEYFHGANNGLWAGLVSSMYQIGAVSALPFIGPCIDTWGRRWGMFIGSLLIVVGTIVSGLTVLNGSVHQFMGGRFLLGFGAAISSAAGPIYVIETAHPAFRGVIGALTNTFYFTGSILAAGAIRGALPLSGTKSWQIPVWLQMVFGGTVCCLCLVVPESPRWLFVHGKHDAAKAMLTYWHGYDDPDSVWVALELQEYEEHLELEGADKRWWDYRVLFKTPSNRYRLFCSCCFSICSQWAGNAVFSYFLPAVLTTAGYTDSISQANINVSCSCVGLFCSFVGASTVDRFGRRPLMIFAMVASSLVWVGMTASTGVFSANGDDRKAAQASIAMVFLFVFAYSTGITPLQSLYPVEVLSYEIRAKGMAFSSLAQNAAGLLNQFAWPVALKEIGWHTYIVFIVWDLAQAAIFYFFLPETKDRTLEELDEIFALKNPVRASLQKKKIALDANDNIVGMEML